MNRVPPDDSLAVTGGTLLQPAARPLPSADDLAREAVACEALLDRLAAHTDILRHSPELASQMRRQLREGKRPRLLELRINGDEVGWLFDVLDVWVLQYSPHWLKQPGAYALAPGLPLREAAHVDGASVRPVQWYFDNLLPEEELRKALAQDARLAFEDAFGLLRHYGAESAGSLVLQPLGAPVATTGLQPLPFDALARRIQQLPVAPLTQAAPKRMSLAGAQNKMVVVYRPHPPAGAEVDTLFEPLAGTASTHILKPNSTSHSYPHSVINEYFVMKLAAALKLNVPSVHRLYLPEPVYLIERFDRRTAASQDVQRIHAIDTCQLLNSPRTLKYERANLPTLLSAVDATRSRALARNQLYQWLVFNVLVGNGDNHLKNLSFTVSARGIELAPGYDMLCTAVYDTPLYAAERAIWPRTALGTVLPQGTHFDEVNHERLLAAGAALGLGESTARRLLQDMLSRIEKEADALMQAIGEDNQALEQRFKGMEHGAPHAAVAGGEMQLLRAIRHVVIRDMVAQVRKG